MSIPSSAKLKVLHSVGAWLPQTMTWLHTQVSFLPAALDNHIYCEETQNLEQFALPNIHNLRDVNPWLAYLGDKSWKVRKLHRARVLKKLIGKHGTQIVHSHFGDWGWDTMQALGRGNYRHVVSFYGYDVNHLPKTRPIWYERYRELFEQADLFLCEGPHFARCLVALGCPEYKVKVQHLGVILDKLPFRPRQWRPGEPLRILISGSFTEKKGISYAIEALGGVKDLASLEITLIGDANHQARNQHEKQQILDAIARHCLESNVRLLGYQPYSVLLEEAYRHHVFLSPSVTSQDGDTEGGAPVTIIEMAASGMPIVSTRHCDIPNVVLDGQSGLLSDERDVDGLVAHLRWLIANPGAWEAMALAGRNRVEHEFNAAIQGEKLAATYQTLIR